MGQLEEKFEERFGFFEVVEEVGVKGDVGEGGLVALEQGGHD